MKTTRQYLLDAGALISVESRARGQLLADLLLAARYGKRPILPAVVLAQVWRDDPRQHAVRKLSNACRILPFTEDTANAVGRLLAMSGSADVVDAAVVVSAIQWNAAVVTSDPQDLAKLSTAVGYDLPMLTV